MILAPHRADYEYSSPQVVPIVERAKRENSPHARIFLSPRRVSPFLAWGDFHACSRFARSTIPEEKWGLLVLYVALVWKRMQQIPTTRNNMQQGVQTDVTCKIQQCWTFFANNVASVCMGLWTQSIMINLINNGSVSKGDPFLYLLF